MRYILSLVSDCNRRLKLEVSIGSDVTVFLTSKMGRVSWRAQQAPVLGVSQKGIWWNILRIHINS